MLPLLIHRIRSRNARSIFGRPQLEEEQAISVREPNSTAHLALKHNQLTSQRGILSLKLADR